MSIASQTHIPSGTLKPFLDTLPNTRERRMRVAEKRRVTSYRPVWPAAFSTRMSDQQIASRYKGRSYDDVEGTQPTADAPRFSLTVEMLTAAGARAGVKVVAGSRTGLWSAGAETDIPLPRLIKVLNNHLRRQGLPPLPDPDTGFLASNKPQASASRMLAHYLELGIE